MKNCTYVLRTVLCLVMLLTAGRMSAQSPFTHQGINASTGDFLGFLQYLPSDYDQHPDTKYPIIIFLHGIGERGNGTTELDKVSYVGMPRIVAKGNKMRFTWNGKTETFLVIAPQCPRRFGMWPAVFVDELIQYAKQNLRIDTNRIFLTGLSMGGGGSLRYISDGLPDYPKNLAAVATCSAPCTFRTGQFATDAHLPIWCFHAEDDPIASVNCTKRAIAGFNSWNPEVKPLLTLWPTGGHIVWDRIYTDTNYQYQGVLNIYEWFLGQNKSLPVNILPVAKGASATITTGTGVANLDASASTDADGQLVRFVWKRISGPDAGVITTKMGTGASTTVTGLNIPGIYQYSVTVVDDRAGFSSDTVTITVNNGVPPPNILPVAHAGNDTVITLPAGQVTLNGRQSSDANGSITAYSWAKISGPSSFAIASSNSATTSVTNLTQGVYRFSLTVTDNQGGKNADTMTVTVNAAPPPPNILPVAHAGNDINITLPVNSITLNGNSSTDADGTINSYFWTWVSGPAKFSIGNPNAPSTAVRSLVEGTYSFRLLVTDNRGGTNADTIHVTVNAAVPPPNMPPVANAGGNKTITLPTNSVSLSGDLSYDPDGTLVRFAWSNVSGPDGSVITSPGLSATTVTGLVAGTYTFRLAVTDNKGASNADTVVVVVDSASVPPPPPNIPPVANAGNNKNITLPVNSAVLNGSASVDPDGTITQYSWTKLSGPAQFTIASPYSSVTGIQDLVEGTYTFRLQVKDNAGALSRDTITVTVNPAPNMPPIANAGQDFTVNLPDPVIRLNGLGSSDPDGTIVGYDWTQVSGPGGITITNSTTGTPGVTGVVEGEYIFRLTVTDNSGAVSFADVKVTVLADGHTPGPPQTNLPPVAEAGPDQVIGIPETTATLDASASHDDNGTIAKYNWLQVSGPSAATIENASAVSTGLSGLVTGDYVFELTVTGNNGASSTDSVTVSVVNNLRYEQQMTLYPNPAKSNVMVQMTSDTTGQATISIYNVSGMLVKSFAATKGPGAFRNSINVSELQAGLYYIEIAIGQKQRMISKLIKK